jgi:hypothetical protein
MSSNNPWGCSETRNGVDEEQAKLNSKLDEDEVEEDTA